MKFREAMRRLFYDPDGRLNREVCFIISCWAAFPFLGWFYLSAEFSGGAE